MSDAPDIATTSTRPYLLRALHEWMLDNQLTPQLVVDAQSPDVQVPRQFVQDGRIVLNVSTSAVRHLILGNEFVEFSARFLRFALSGQRAGCQCVGDCGSRENGAGMSFPPEPETRAAERSQDEEPGDTDSPPDDPPPPRPPSAKRGHLKIVK